MSLKQLSQLIVAGIACASALALLTVAVVLRVTAQGPAEVVREYLTAIRDKRVDDALALARPARPPGDAGAFLVAGAIGGGWDVGEVGVAYHGDVGRKPVEAQVRATLVRDGEEFAGTFDVVHTGAAWRIANPFVVGTWSSSPLWYLELNDVRVPRPAGPRSDESARYAFFPGIYHDFRRRTALYEPVPTTWVALPGTTNEIRTTLTVTAAANQEFQRAYDTIFDDCAAGRRNCDLIPAESRHVTAQGYVPHEKLTSRAWRVVRRPVVNLTGRTSHLDSGDMAVVGQAVVPGEVRLTATGPAGAAGRPVTFTKVCLVLDIDLVAGFRVDGSMVTDRAPGLNSQAYWAPKDKNHIKVWCHPPAA